MSYQLTEAEALDVAHIVREYARKIRSDLEAIETENKASGDYGPTPPSILAALRDAATSREKLADRIEEAA